MRTLVLARCICTWFGPPGTTLRARLEPAPGGDGSCPRLVLGQLRAPRSGHDTPRLRTFHSGRAAQHKTGIHRRWQRSEPFLYQLSRIMVRVRLPGGNGREPFGGRMSDQTLDLRRCLLLVRRHKIIVGTFAALGLAAGVGLTVMSPAMLSSNALVVLPVSVRNIATQVVVASSDPVLSGALRTIDSRESPQTLRNSIQVKALTSNILSVSAQGKTAAEAEDTANAIAESYVGYVGAGTRSGVRVQARVLERATN